MLALWSHNDALLVMTTRWVKTGNWFTGMAVGLCLVAAVLSRTGAGHVIAQGTGTTHAQLRQPTMRRGRARSCGLQRPQSPRARRQRTRVRGLPRAIRGVPAFSRGRQGSLRGVAGEVSAQQERGRSALPACGRRRLPCQRRQRERLLEPGGQRACSRHDAVAAERQARRPGHRSAVRTTPPSISGAR